MTIITRIASIVKFSVPLPIMTRHSGILQAIPFLAENTPTRYTMQDETRLLRHLHNLDPETITAIHQHFYPEVYRYAHYRIGNIEHAEDIASEVFLRLLDALHNGKGPRTSLRGWLMGTAANLVNDHFRKAYQNPVEMLHENLEAHGTNPVTQAEKAEQNHTLRAALFALTREQQHVLAIRFGSGCSLAETAEIMGKRPNAIKQLQFRALQALRRQLGGSFNA